MAWSQGRDGKYRKMQGAERSDGLSSQFLCCWICRDRGDIWREGAASVYLHSPEWEDGLFPPGSGLECAWSLWGWKCRVISSERKDTSRGFSRSGGDLAASKVQDIHGWLGCNPPSAAL